ncbi:sensor histidine kinase [Nitrosopumilus cobalaminigenes]|nr:HAMP domain-containing sensor histidine kinase [Nitrosopumilus cobalaminigenes]
MSILVTEIQNNTIQRTENFYSTIISESASRQLVPTDFDLNDLDNKQQIFDNFFQQIKTDEMLRIKVWSSDGTIICSDDQLIVGKNFNDNLRFQHSIAGEITSEIKNPVDPENISEMGYGQMMEIYIPITLDSTTPLGVIELYYNMDSINDTIAETQLITIINTVIFISIIVSGIIIFSIFTIRSSNKTIEQEKFASIGNLSSRMAHDIRNPLTVIKTTLDLLKTKNKNLSSDELEKLKKLDNQIYRISHQVNNVLDYIKGQPLILKTNSLKEILDSSIHDLPEHDGIEIESTVSNTKIHCDYEALKVVFINLFYNAIQSLGKKGKIKISSEIIGVNTLIKIEDSGPGIPEDKLNKIFEPLYTTKQEGTGLGLASCKSIIEQHRGTISVKNNPTTFTITLPTV